MGGGRSARAVSAPSRGKHGRGAGPHGCPASAARSEQAVKLARVLADDLALHRWAHPREILGNPFLRVWPDPVRMRIVRSPHDAVLADEGNHRGHRRLVLVRRVALSPPEL